MNRVLAICLLCGLAAAACDEGSTLRQPAEPEGLRTAPIADREPGSVTMRRLNRAEYNNTVRDLLGTNLQPANDFPPDDTGHGYDNIGDVLSLSPLHLELYERAADQLVREVMRPVLASPIQTRIEAELTGAPAGVPYQGMGWMLWTEDEVGAPVNVPMTGPYRVQVHAFADEIGDEPALMSLQLDGNNIATVEVTTPATFTFDVRIDQGKHQLSVAFRNPFFDESGAQRRALIVDWIALEGPTNLANPDQQPRARVMICTPEANVESERACARQILQTFADRAWRRPATTEQIDRLMAILADAERRGRDFEARVALGLEAILISPQFLFRPESMGRGESTEPVLLDDYAYASRLSYFIWSSTPDDALLAAAEAGLIGNEEAIRAQVHRMLADPRAEALVDNFGGQWLYIRDVKNAFPDVWVFPEFDEELQTAMAEEMRLFFRTFVFEDRSMVELLTAREVWVNARLARHYGVPYAGDGSFVRVELEEGHQRTGMMTQAGLLTVLSAPHRTSIVRRGKWMLEQLLCEPPPDPPAGVEGLVDDEDDKTQLSGTLRERMEQHSSDPACNGCHSEMDPLGFALEHFDGIGAWRDMDGDDVIDSLGEFPDGRTFHGALEMQGVLANDEAFPRCVTKQLMTYALGRGVTGKDYDVHREIAAAFVEDDYRLEALVTRIVLSDPFRFNSVRPLEGDE